MEPVFDKSTLIKGNEASSSVEQLPAAIQQGQEKEDQGNQPVEIPQPESQTLGVEDEEDLPKELQRRYVCDICGRVFRSRSGLLTHKTAAHEEAPFTCHICGKTMKWERNLTLHLRAVHNFAPKEILKKKKNRICKECGETFRNNGLLYYHMRKVHKIAKPVSCEVCGESFKTESAKFYEHKKLHPNHYHFHTCDVCKLMFARLAPFQKHLLETGHARNVKGPVDIKGDDEIGGEITSGKNTEGGDEKTVAEDSTVSGDKEQTDNVQLACPYKCGSVFASYGGYRSHTRNNTCHNGKKLKSPIIHCEKSLNDQLLCCGKVYESNKEYREHIDIHKHDFRCNFGKRNDRKFECPTCRTIVNSSGLLYHQKKHSGITDYACDLCNYKCILAKDLKKHKLIHSKIRPHPCKFCGRTFQNISNQREHERMHVLVKQDVYIDCPKCPRRFRFETERRKHLKSCKGSEGHNLGNIHALASGSLGYMCNVCLGFFFVKMTMTNHKKNTCYRKSTAELETEINVQAKTTKVPNESGEGKEVSLENLYICKVCSQVFENQSDHKAHECQCRPTQRNRKPRGKKICKGSSIKTGTANDLNNADDNDDKMTEDIESDDTFTHIPSPSSIPNTVQAKQTVNIKPKEVATKQTVGSIRQKAMCEGSDIRADVADIHDDADDLDDKITEDEESDSTDTRPSSIVQAKQTVSIKQENIATSSLVLSSIKCDHKTTAVINRQECVYQSNDHEKHECQYIDVNHDTHDDNTSEIVDAGDIDDTDDSDDKIKGVEESHIQVSNRSSKLTTVQPKQTGMKKKKAATCSLISSSITCSTCNKTTDEIIKQECSMHQVGVQTELEVKLEVHPDGRVHLRCNTCQKTTERLLLEHKCTPHFYL